MALATHAGKDEFVSMSAEMSKWVDQVLGSGYQPFRPAKSWTPAVNVYEDNDHYRIVVDLAAVQTEQIDLRTERGVLVLSGRRELPGPNRGGRQTKVHLMEIDHGDFSRALPMPEDVEVDKISATYKCGLLCIRLPKKS